MKKKKKQNQPLSDLDGEDLFESRGLLTKELFVRGVDMERRSVDVIASTAAIDSHEEIVEQDWDLSRYDRNPVVLWHHNRLFQQDTLPIGRGENVKVVDGKLQATIIFASEAANPSAERVLRLFDEKIQRAVSVGFRPGDIRQEKRDGRTVTVLAKNLLVEISVTPIGSNPEALAKALDTLRRDIDAARGSAISIPSAPDASDETHDDTMEKDMSEHNYEKQIADLTAACASEKAKAVILDQRCADLEVALKEEKARADGFAREKVEKELDDLIGTKIAPAEKGTLLELWAQAPEVYAKHVNAISGRPDMPHLKAIIPPNPAAEAPRLEGDNGTGFDALVRRNIFG